MRISEVLRHKGDRVVLLRPEDSVNDMLATLAEERIGAAVVSADGGATVAGMASERDVVRALHARGTAVLQEPVSAIMTTKVWTCSPDDELEVLAVSMTEHRVRHLPVIQGGRLVGLVSIGDVVKSRLEELQDERQHLLDYVQGD